jgi:hypothetical protein
MKHTNEGICPSCEDKLKDGHPDIVYWFHRIKEHFPTAHCAWVFRSKEEQDRMVAEKASKLTFPNSKHNFTQDGKPCSKAMDLFSLGDHGEANFRLQYYVQIANWLEDVNAPITWGGTFKHLVDGDHFELKG